MAIKAILIFMLVFTFFGSIAEKDKQERNMLRLQTIILIMVTLIAYNIL